MKNLMLFLMLFASSLTFAKPVKDPRVDAAKKASWVLTQQYLAPSKTKLIQAKIIEQADGFFLTNVIVSTAYSSAKWLEPNARTVRVNIKNIVVSYCLAIEVSIAEDGAISISYLENHNDIKNVYIQECSNPPTTNDIAKIKSLNGWFNKD